MRHAAASTGPIFASSDFEHQPQWMAGGLHPTMMLAGVAKVKDLKRRNVVLAKA